MYNGNHVMWPIGSVVVICCIIHLLVMQVISNTTTSRPDAVLGLVHADETGGLSGKPLFKMSTEALRDM
jgi:dihydroorotate dehydrogenase